MDRNPADLIVQEQSQAMEGSGGYEDLENRKIAPPDDARQLLGLHVFSGVVVWGSDVTP